MSPSRLYVVVPSLLPTGPVKGAAALCNGLAGRLPVTLVVLKEAKGPGVHLSPDVHTMSLAHLPNWRAKIDILQKEYDQAGGRGQVASVSFCLSADAVNFLLKRFAFIATSVRGNLPQNYRYDFGLIGPAIAYLHLMALHRFDRVIAMSTSMQIQLRRFGLKRLSVIGNFVDETHLEGHRKPVDRDDDKTRFLFLASLTKRKRPELVLEAARKLRDRGYDFHIDIAGSGPLEETLRQRAEHSSLGSHIRFHGQVSQPFDLIQDVDYLILPSESEGISRAVLEALFFGVPCILRDVDANRELITPGRNGELFRSDEELVDLMAHVLSAHSGRHGSGNLLPTPFRQQTNAQLYLSALTR